MQKIFIATSLLFAACHNPNYCAGSPDNNCNETGDGGTTIDGNESISCVQTGCVNNSAGSVCDTDTKACVQCTDGPAGDHSACTLTTPVCSTTDTCRACAANSECASDACLPDGSCAAATDVAYVNATTGSGLTLHQGCAVHDDHVREERQIDRSSHGHDFRAGRGPRIAHDHRRPQRGEPDHEWHHGQRRRNDRRRHAR